GSSRPTIVSSYCSHTSHSNFQSYWMRAHARSGLPATVAGVNLHIPSPALAASSRRRWPEDRSTLLSSTLPSTSIRKVKDSRGVSLARIEAAGYVGFVDGTA